MVDVSNFVPRVVQRYAPVFVIALGGLHVFQGLRKYATDVIASIQKRRMLENWAKQSLVDEVNVVILHVFPAGKTITNPSPFAIKLETFMRMNNIQYRIDTDFPKGEKDKTPWITLNGEHFTDSEFIIAFLEKKFDTKSGSSSYSRQDYSVGTMARIMMDEHFYWGLIHWRYIYSGGQHLCDIFPSFSPNTLETMKKLWRPKYITYTWYQGIGRHTHEEIITLMCDDLRTLSLIIGSKTFLLGDEPSRDDCAVFGMLSEVVWAEVGSPYQILIAEDLKNLQEYCNRMKERFWPDWDQLLAK